MEQLDNIIAMPAEGETDTFVGSEGELPFLPLRNVVLFPNVLLSIIVARKKSHTLVIEAYQTGAQIVTATQRDTSVEDPALTDIYESGTIAKVIKIYELPDGSTSAILQGIKRAKITEINSGKLYQNAKFEVLEDILPANNDKQFIALIEAIKDLAIKIAKLSNEIPGYDIIFAVRNFEDPNVLVSYISANYPIKVDVKASILALDSLQDRADKLFEALTNEAQLLDIKTTIESKAQSEINRQHREYYLQQQMKTIQDELGGNVVNQDIENLKGRAKDKKWDDTVKAIFEKELSKLERMHPHAPDYPVQQNYVDTIVSLPWNEYSDDNLDMKHAREILDRDHFGLEKVKDRIIEHLAVLKLKKDLKAPIVCLWGPPGVGKTSLGKSIADVLERKYIRVSLGGLNDEAEIRGHRRTYIGSMCGRILSSIKKAGTSNPVFVLDEIDKLSSDYRGDPASAMLEVLDPEQNNAFHDNFLDIDFDLSKVLFIATANSIASIPQPLLDRMELIEVNGYIPDEKCEIAVRHLIPKQLKLNGLDNEQIKFSESTIRDIIASYTRESGVRELDRLIAKVMRKIATKIALEEPYSITAAPEHLKEYLGLEKFDQEKFHGEELVGVVTGLAWTQFGGEILYIETSLNRTKGGKLTLTGNLGAVMKESAMLALEYIKSHAKEFDISEKKLDQHSVHIHVPEGAVPKDGPSAGVAILTAMVSSFTERKVKKRFAMTGEITLRGKVLPVGGIKEKILAAKRAGITDIILCSDNQKDIDDIKNTYLEGLNFHYIKNMKQAIDIALD
ncbi:MAG: endopeptidase La [Prevotellaceae bacterium]|nr:endopeptidase La [Prevotellaceae bacterium]